jgi:hypothetical protein
MEHLVKIDLAADFSAHPFGRYPVHGPVNGQRFRNEVLVPALNRSKVVLVDIDGTSGLSSSFLDEAFAGLVRMGAVPRETFFDRIQIKSMRDPTYIEDIAEYVGEAELAV